MRAFLKVLEISRDKVSIAMEKLHLCCFDDLRVGAKNVLSDKSRNAILDHINSFPHYLSHYRRETSSALYLDPELNTATMYRLFKDKWSTDNDCSPAPSIDSYVKIFDSLGLKLKNLKNDTCKTCDKLQNEFKNASTTEKSQIENIRGVHWDNAAALRGQMKEDFATGKINPKVFYMHFTPLTSLWRRHRLLCCR